MTDKKEEKITYCPKGWKTCEQINKCITVGSCPNDGRPRPASNPRGVVG